MKDTITELFEDHCIGVALILLLFGIALTLGISFGFYTLAIWLASMCFGFAFKWVYVFGLWVGVLILKSIFKVRKIKVED